MIEFSINQQDKEKKYIKRPGAYGIIKDANNLISLIKTKTGYFLLGGGIENGESPDECLKRECLEEIGAEISELDNFAHGTCNFYSPKLNVNMESDGYFFTCKIDNFLETKIEEDHELIWMKAEEVIPLLYLDNQREAVRIFNTKNI